MLKINLPLHMGMPVLFCWPNATLLHIPSPYSVAPEATISQKPTVTVSEGDPAVVMCTATGVPSPTISWYLDGVLLADEDSTETPDAATFSVTSDLMLTSVMRESAFAIITCTASNGVGANSSDSTQLIVLCKLFVLLVISN